MWMDHRAKSETEHINKMGHPVLQAVGGSISVEMQMPKLLWLKKNKQQLWKNATCFLDLSDYLTWRATGSDVRSLCSAVCKWTYHGDGNKCGWNSSFFEGIGLNDLVEDGFCKIGKSVIAPGSFVGYLLPGVVSEMKIGRFIK